MFSEGTQAQFSEPMARWESADADPTVLAQRLRFPYACNVVVPNRFMKSAMSEQMATYEHNDMMKSGIPTRELINLYEKFADGGFGIIVTGSIMVNGRDLEAPGNVIIDKELDSEERRAAFKDWTQTTKKNGSVFLAQLFHPGQKAADLPKKTNFDVNTLTQQQINELVEQYAYAATFAQECGFDGIEISCAYFFALGQFLTEGANTRSDEYGGSLENRSRILFRIIQAIRMRVRRPNSFAIGLKLFSGNFEPGYNEDDFGQFIRSVEKTGFDYIAITGGHYYLLKGLKGAEAKTKKHEHFYQAAVPAIKKNLTRTKLYMNGGFVTLADMCEAINDGWAMGVSLARPVAAEPGLPNKLMNGEAKGAVKSLIDPLDFATSQQIAGTQLWQHGWFLPVMDASNPEQVEQFKKDLAAHQERKAAVSADHSEPIVGYPKMVLCTEESAEPMVNGFEACASEQPTEDITLDVEATKVPAEEQNEMTEEHTHRVVKKQLDNGSAPGDLHESVIEDTVHKIVRRSSGDEHEGIEIIEETIEKVTRTEQVFAEPPHGYSSVISSGVAPQEELKGEEAHEVGEETAEVPKTPEQHEPIPSEIAHEDEHGGAEAPSSEIPQQEVAEDSVGDKFQKLFDDVAQKVEKLAHDVAQKVEGAYEPVEEFAHKEVHEAADESAPTEVIDDSTKTREEVEPGEEEKPDFMGRTPTCYLVFLKSEGKEEENAEQPLVDEETSKDKAKSATEIIKEPADISNEQVEEKEASGPPNEVEETFVLAKEESLAAEKPPEAGEEVLKAIDKELPQPDETVESGANKEESSAAEKLPEPEEEALKIREEEPPHVDGTMEPSAVKEESSAAEKLPESEEEALKIREEEPPHVDGTMEPLAVKEEFSAAEKLPESEEEALKVRKEEPPHVDGTMEPSVIKEGSSAAENLRETEEGAVEGSETEPAHANETMELAAEKPPEAEEEALKAKDKESPHVEETAKPSAIEDVSAAAEKLPESEEGMVEGSEKEPPHANETVEPSVIKEESLAAEKLPESEGTLERNEKEPPHADETVESSAAEKPPEAEEEALKAKKEEPLHVDETMEPSAAKEAPEAEEGALKGEKEEPVQADGTALEETYEVRVEGVTEASAGHEPEEIRVETEPSYVEGTKTPAGKEATSEVISGISSENEPIISGIAVDESRPEPEGAVNETVTEPHVIESPVKEDHGKIGDDHPSVDEPIQRSATEIIAETVAPVGAVTDENAHIATKAGEEYASDVAGGPHEEFQDVHESFDNKPQLSEYVESEGTTGGEVSNRADEMKDVGSELEEAVNKISADLSQAVLDKAPEDSYDVNHEISSETHATLFGSSAANEEPLELEHLERLERVQELKTSENSEAPPETHDHTLEENKHDGAVEESTKMVTPPASGLSDGAPEQQDVAKNRQPEASEKKSHGFSFITSALPDSVQSLFSSKKTKVTSSHDDTSSTQEVEQPSEGNIFDETFNRLEEAASDALHEAFDRIAQEVPTKEAGAETPVESSKEVIGGLSPEHVPIVSGIVASEEGSLGASHSDMGKDGGLLSEKADGSTVSKADHANSSSHSEYHRETRVVMETRNGKTHGYVFESSSDKKSPDEMDFEFIH